MSTLAKMVPQVMLFQKIVSNLGALFSMQTPLGSRTIYFLPLTRDLVLIYIYVNWIANLTWRPLGQAAFLLSSENSSLNFVLSHQVAAFVCCKLSADLQCIPVKQCLPSFHFAFSASLQFLSQRLVSTLLWFCSNSQAFSSVPSVGWKGLTKIFNPATELASDDPRKWSACCAC